MHGAQPGEHGYPRPQLQRAQWESLNGEWEFAIDEPGDWRRPDEVRYDARIRVPFSPETPASGVDDRGLYHAVWYRRVLDREPPAGGRRLILHFGAVDHDATVWVNGTVVARHTGGYTPFWADITEVLDAGGRQEIVVHAADDPTDLTKPRGKQDWLPEPHSIWYHRTTGIWQTVWLEEVPETRFAGVRWGTEFDRWRLRFTAVVTGPRTDDNLRVRVVITAGDEEIATDEYGVRAGEVHRAIALSDPGLDGPRNRLLWSPDRPTLMDATIVLLDATGEELDRVESYTALREVGVDGARFLLNNRPVRLRMALDQGYWPESGLTAPDDDALRRDVELAKEMGFNGVRKHQKIEDPRYLYWADRLGLFVWEEMPSVYRHTRVSMTRLIQTWMEALERDYSHPCIVAWVPFNESWGVPNLPNVPEHRHSVEALYHLTKMFDASRPVIGNDGWESLASDILGVHDYSTDLELLEQRYAAPEQLVDILRREQPYGRRISLDPETHAVRPVMLTEFGGITLATDPNATWGYDRTEGSEDLERRYHELLEVVRRLPLAGFCYTQFADTYQESNGLLFADRTPKFPLDQIRRATRGPRNLERWLPGSGFSVSGPDGWPLQTQTVPGD